MYAFQNEAVKKAFESFPAPVREKLILIRGLIFEEASRNPNVGAMRESLKWGQPSYVSLLKSGSPIRLGMEKKNQDKFGLYVHCQTNLVETFKHIYPHAFTYGANRSILFKTDELIEEEPLRHCITIALTYHLKK